MSLQISMQCSAPARWYRDIEEGETAMVSRISPSVSPSLSQSSSLRSASSPSSTGKPRTSARHCSGGKLSLSPMCRGVFRQATAPHDMPENVAVYMARIRQYKFPNDLALCLNTDCLVCMARAAAHPSCPGAPNHPGHTIAARLCAARHRSLLCRACVCTQSTRRVVFSAGAHNPSYTPACVHLHC